KKVSVVYSRIFFVYSSSIGCFISRPGLMITVFWARDTEVISASMQAIETSDRMIMFAPLVRHAQAAATRCLQMGRLFKHRGATACSYRTNLESGSAGSPTLPVMYRAMNLVDPKTAKGYGTKEKNGTGGEDAGHFSPPKKWNRLKSVPPLFHRFRASQRDMEDSSENGRTGFQPVLA